MEIFRFSICLLTKRKKYFKMLRVYFHATCYLFCMEVEGLYRRWQTYTLMGGPESRVNGIWRHKPPLDVTRLTFIFRLSSCFLFFAFLFCFSFSICCLWKCVDTMIMFTPEYFRSTNILIFPAAGLFTAWGTISEVPRRKLMVSC